MKRAGLMLCLVIMLATVAPAAAAPTVLDAVFLVLQDGKVTETNRVPLIPGEVCFQWQIRLDVPDGPVEFTEVFTLPAAPDVWNAGPDEGVEISGDGAISTVTDTYDVKDGWLLHGWCLAEGDPLGQHKMEISVDGTLLHTFVFQVIEPGTLYL